MHVQDLTGRSEADSQEHVKKVVDPAVQRRLTKQQSEGCSGHENPPHCLVPMAYGE